MFMVYPTGAFGDAWFNMKARCDACFFADAKIVSLIDGEPVVVVVVVVVAAAAAL